MCFFHRWRRSANATAKLHSADSDLVIWLIEDKNSSITARPSLAEDITSVKIVN